MRLLVPLVVLAIAVACVCASQMDQDRKWQRFKLRFNKQYESRIEEEKSYQRYKKNLRSMENQRSTLSYKLKETPYSDIDPEEDKITGRGFVYNYENLEEGRGVSERYTPSAGLRLPTSYNFMKETNCRLVTKHQGSCGSCWAFSSTTAIEGQLCKKTGKLVELSPQFFVDCKPRSGGCNGDWPKATLEYNMDSGVNLERDYPYKGYKQQYCYNYNPQKKFTISKSLVIPYDRNNNAENIRLHKSALVEHGPFVITLFSSNSNFMSYGGGIFDDRGYACGRYPDHAVVLVGYGVENGVEYWLIKNSWGMDWGEEGYIKLKIGTCSMFTHSIIPVINDQLAYTLRNRIEPQDIEEGDPLPGENTNDNNNNNTEEDDGFSCEGREEGYHKDAKCEKGYYCQKNPPRIWRYKCDSGSKLHWSGNQLQCKSTCNFLTVDEYN